MHFDPQTNIVPPDEAAPQIRTHRPVKGRAGPLRGTVLGAALATVLGGAWFIYAEMPVPEPAQGRVEPVWQAVVSDPAATEAYIREVQLQAEQRHLEAESREAYEAGRDLLAVGRTQEAVPHLKQSIRLDPQFAKARYDLGLAYVRVGNMDGARAEHRNLRTVDPSLANLLANLIPRQR